jgi:hypothetical protein
MICNALKFYTPGKNETLLFKSVGGKKRKSVISLFVYLPCEKRGLNAGLNLQAVLEVKREPCLFLLLQETRDKRCNEQIKRNTVGTMTVAE